MKNYFDKKRGNLISRFLDLNLGWDSSLNSIPFDEFQSMVEELENTVINLEADEGLDVLRSIIEKYENQKPRNFMLRVRLTEVERTELQDAARVAGMSISEYSRRKIFS